VALIWIRATSRLAGYYPALVSFRFLTDGCPCLMPMEFSDLLHRLLTDSRIDFASLKGGT